MSQPEQVLDADRLQRLIEAGRALVAELDLDAVLHQLLQTARELTGARYAAIGVLDDSRTELQAFITAGIDGTRHREIGELPRGRGILGLLIEDPKPLRLRDVTMHPQSYGFPPAHPEMSTFLGVPVLIRGEAWGNLYLTEKHDGEEFDQADELSATTLASWAGIAIENARLYRGAQERRAELERAVRGLEASTAIARAIGGETRLDRVLELIAKRGRALVGARRVAIALAEGDELVVATAAGADSRDLLGKRVRRGAPLVDDEHGISVPLTFRERSLGILAAYGRLTGDDPFGPDDEQLLLGFAASAATAVATAQSVERDRLRYALDAAEAERGRWARELHDETLQGLAALRVGLAAAARSEDADALREAVQAAVEQIRGEITNLRGIIADLRPAALDQLGLGAALEALADRVASSEGLEIDVEVDLLPLPSIVETTVYRLVQEAFTNVKKHARATKVRLSVAVRDDDVVLSVADDGAGFDPHADTAGFGLRGMRERAALVGGTLDVESGEAGTTVRAQVPIRS